MTKRFKEGDRAMIVEESDKFDSKFSKYGVKIGDTAEIRKNISGESPYDYIADIYRSGDIVEPDLGIAEGEIRNICTENHKLLWHDRREEYFCPFCSASEETPE